MGIRGIPARYGGFETFAEEIAPRLVERGHKVTVYGRKNVIKDYKKGQYYKGVRLMILPTISHKYFDTVFHTFLSVIHALFDKYDVILMCNAANAIFCLLPRLIGTKVILNVDGIERRRKKWNFLGKLWYFLGEILACVFPNEIVTDAEVIRRYYLKRYRRNSIMIPYGCNAERVTTEEILKEWGLKKDEYILYVSRLEPENNAHVVIEAFKKVKTQKKLVIVGDAPYSLKYKKKLYKLAKEDKRIIFTGYIFGKGYKELQANAYCYVHATEVGGTHPALVEAMGFGNCVIANGTPENIEVVGEAGIVYRKNEIEDLRKKLQYVIDNFDVVKNYRKKAQERAKKKYSWKVITDEYEKLFFQMLEAYKS